MDQAFKPAAVTPHNRFSPHRRDDEKSPGSDAGGDVIGQLPKQSVDFKFDIKSGSIDKRNNHPLEVHSCCKTYQSTDTSHFF